MWYCSGNYYESRDMAKQHITDPTFPTLLIKFVGTKTNLIIWTCNCNIY